MLVWRCMFELLLSAPGAAHPETELLCHRASVLPCLVLVVVSIEPRACACWTSTVPLSHAPSISSLWTGMLVSHNGCTCLTCLPVWARAPDLCVPLSCVWMAILIDTQCPLLLCVSQMSCEAEGTFWPFLSPWFGDLSTLALGFQSGCLLWRLSFSCRIFLTYILIWTSEQICDLQIFSPLRGLAFTHVRD